MPRTTVVTGASAGVGRAVARALAQRGDDVALLARNHDGLQAAAAEVRAAGARALPIFVDVADAGAVDRAADQVEKELGPIDVWVNNAMQTVFSPLADMTAEEFRRVTEVTYLGSVHGTMSALRRMTPRDHRHDRSSGVRAGLPGDPAAVRVLRRQARLARLLQQCPSRAGA